MLHNILRMIVSDRKNRLSFEAGGFIMNLYETNRYI